MNTILTFYLINILLKNNNFRVAIKVYDLKELMLNL